MKTWKECQTIGERREFLDACETQKSWFRLGMLCLVWAFAVLVSSCGYVGQPTEHVADTTNYQHAYIFMWNNHSYLRFGWVESQSVVHNPDCLCYQQFCSPSKTK